MKKEIFTRSVMSFAFSVLITQFVMLTLDVIFKDYAPLVPAFSRFFSSDTVALSVNNILIGLIGAAFGGASVIFEIESWSFLKQGVIHFIVTMVVWLPIATFLWGLYMYPGAVISTSISISLTYCITWITRYIICRKSIGAINQELKTMQESEHSAS